MKAKYHEIEEILLDRLQSGAYPVGERLPTEHELADEFGVNRHTLRRAIGLLVDAGYIDRAPRRGSVVMRRPGDAATGEPVTVTWHQLPENSAREEASNRALVAAFEAAHPGLRLRIMSYPRGQSLTPQLPDVSGQAGPHVLSLAYGANYAASGQLAPLDEMEGFYGAVKPFEGRLMQELDGPGGARGIYALPRRMGSWMALANRSLLTELGLGDAAAPRTWAELRDLGRQIRDASNGTVYLMDLEFHLWPQSFARFVPWFLSANDGKQLIDPQDGRVQFDTPANRAYLQYLRELLDEDIVCIRTLADGFVKRRAVLAQSMTQGGVASAGRWLPTDDVEPWAFPARDAEARSLTIMRGEYVALLDASLKSDADREAGWALLRFLTSKEQQEILADAGVHLPVRMDAASVIAPDSTMRRYLDYGMTYGQPMFDVIRHDDVHYVLCSTVARYLAGGDLDYLMSQGQELLEHYMAERPAPTLDKALIHEVYA